MKKKKIITYILILLTSLALGFLIYLSTMFYAASFEQILYSIQNFEGTSFDAMEVGIIYTTLFTICFLVLFFLVDKILKKKFNINISLLCSLILLIMSVSLLGLKTGVFKFVYNKIVTTDIYEEYYVSVDDVEITFPENKRNLIYIYLESIESTSLSIDNGGTAQVSYMPNLEDLALNNLNFSNTDKIGGALQVDGTTWTAAAMVAQTSGVPLTVVGIITNPYKDETNFLPGVITLGDILYEQGYHNYLMLGSDATFGGRKYYFNLHGNYEIFDYYTAINENKIDEDYFEWWGYEDEKLFTYAKEKLLEIASNNEPFNYTMLTADTHFTDGYLESDCELKFDTNYANSFYCSDNRIGEFINWIKEQDFYDNTTIIITGDHLTMQSNFYDLPNDYNRTVYNVVINSNVSAVNNKNRTFTTMDMYPTTLASLGVNIEGNRLGLGTNLFSDTKTLAEELSIEVLNKEISKKSNYYNKELLKLN